MSRDEKLARAREAFQKILKELYGPLPLTIPENIVRKTLALLDSPDATLTQEQEKQDE